MANKNILLIEPGYKNKYPPLGLMKIARYHGPSGKRDFVKFIKGIDKAVVGTCWDRIYVTTLFTFEWRKISEAIDFAIEVAGGFSDKVFVGGIAASLMHDRFVHEPRWSGVRFIPGLLNKAPATSLGLDPFAEELYSDDIKGLPIEDQIPDYSILDQVNYSYPVRDAYFAYASRGCVRTCSFCGVPKLEGDLYETPSLTSIVKGIENSYGTKKDLVLMDNNITASFKFKELMAEIRDLGFTAGAKLKRGRIPVNRRVDFNQGVDARILCKTPMYLRELATTCVDPLRIAFDHLGFRTQYEQSVRYAHEFGIVKLSNYMLYNFNDSPEDLYQRMWINIMLNEELKIRIFSFPMRYQPTNRADRTHVGKHWNRYYLRSMQLILQATHGIVSGAPAFFKRAFGESKEAFRALLGAPHKFIFNRVWFEEHGGRAEREAYLSNLKRLSPADREDLLSALAAFEKPGLYEQTLASITNTRVARLFAFYKPLSHEEEADIWAHQKRVKTVESDAPLVPDDERVEDAGLEVEPS